MLTVANVWYRGANKSSPQRRYPGKVSALAAQKNSGEICPPIRPSISLSFMDTPIHAQEPGLGPTAAGGQRPLCGIRAGDLSCITVRSIYVS
jgi:hypothetical protein